MVNIPLLPFYPYISIRHLYLKKNWNVDPSFSLFWISVSHLVMVQWLLMIYLTNFIVFYFSQVMLKKQTSVNFNLIINRRHLLVTVWYLSHSRYSGVNNNNLLLDIKLLFKVWHSQFYFKFNICHYVQCDSKHMALLKLLLQYCFSYIIVDNVQSYCIISLCLQYYF